MRVVSIYPMYPQYIDTIYPMRCDFHKNFTWLKSKWNPNANHNSWYIICIFNRHGFLFFYYRWYGVPCPILSKMHVISHLLFFLPQMWQLRYILLDSSHVRMWWCIWASTNVICLYMVFWWLCCHLVMRLSSHKKNVPAEGALIAQLSFAEVTKHHVNPVETEVEIKFNLGLS